MTSSTYKRGAMITTLVLAAALGSTQFNSSPTLKIGDSAPPIKVQTWVRGKPISQFEKGKVYVVDFWATWCGGCIASFPHISSIAEKYKGKVNFFSIDSYEELGENKGKDPVPVVTEFLKTSDGQNLKLDVCVDGVAKVMYNTWVNTLRRNGFPTTFVVDQEGMIAWVDVNLDHLDWVLGQVVAKKWDRSKAAAVMQERDALEDMMFKTFRDKGDHKPEYQAMLAGAEAFEKRFPDRKDAVEFTKYWALNELDQTRVPAHLEEMAANPLARYIHLADAAGLTLRRKDLTKRDYLAVAKVQERLLQNQHPGTGYGGKSIKAYQELATTYKKAGESKNAENTIERAIAFANQIKAPVGQVNDLKELLKKYRANSKPIN